MSTEIELKAHVRNSEELKLILMKKAEYLWAFDKTDTYWFSGGVSGLLPSGLRIRREKRGLPDGTEKSLCFATYKRKTLIDGIEINNEYEFEVNPAAEFEEFLQILGFKPGFSKRKHGWAFIDKPPPEPRTNALSGTALSLKELTVELAEVDGLGWFVELEILADCNEVPPGGRAVYSGQAVSGEAGEGLAGGGTAGNGEINCNRAGNNEAGGGPGGNNLPGNDSGRKETLAEGKRRLLDFLAGLGIGREAIESRFYTEMLVPGTII